MIFRRHSFFWIIFLTVSVLSPKMFAMTSKKDIWHFQAAQALELAEQGGLANWRRSIAMGWTEPEIVRQKLLALSEKDKERLQMALELLESIDDEALEDQNLRWTTVMLQSCLGKTALAEVSVKEVSKAIKVRDNRLEIIDLALYLRDWNTAEELLMKLEAEGTNGELSYRRAILAGLYGDRLSEVSLWKEALAQKLNITPAVYKDMIKAGLGGLTVGQRLPKQDSSLNDYFNLFNYIIGDDRLPAETIFPKGVLEGYVLYDSGNEEAAIKKWRVSLEQTGFEGVLYTLIGHAYLRLGRYQYAQTAFEQALAADSPNAFPAYLGLINIYQNQGRIDKATRLAEQGYLRTNSPFFGQTEIIQVCNLEREALTTDGHGYSLISLPGVYLKNSEGLWISTDRGFSWRWYPWLRTRIRVPDVSEYWIQGTGDSVGFILRSDLKQQNEKDETEFMIDIPSSGGQPTAILSSSYDIHLHLEYWFSNGPKHMIESSKPQNNQQLVLEDTQPGREYNYRAVLKKDQRTVAIKEGTFATKALPMWYGFTSQLLSNLQLLVRPTDYRLADSFRVSWDENGEWSEWLPVQPEILLDVPQRHGKRLLKVQFCDARGYSSPIISEEINIDLKSPDISDLSRDISNSGITYMFRTDEPAVVRIWMHLDGQWRQVSKHDEFEEFHYLWLPDHFSEVNIWVEDRAGNIRSVSHGNALYLSPFSLRVNGGDNMTSSRDVLLFLQGSTRLRNALVRFSDDGRLWSQWETWQSQRNWRLKGMPGEKKIFAQIRVGEEIFEISESIILAQVSPVISQLELEQNDTGRVVITLNTDRPTRTRFFISAYDQSSQIIQSVGFTKEHRLVTAPLESGEVFWRLEVFDYAGNTKILDGGSFSSNVCGPIIFPDQVDFDVEDSDMGRQEVVLNFTAKAVEPSLVRVRNAGGFWSHWMTYNPRIQWMVRSLEGPQEIEVQFKNGNGSISPIETRLLRLDISPPRIYSFLLEQNKLAQDRLRWTWQVNEPAVTWLVGYKEEDSERESEAVLFILGTKSELSRRGMHNLTDLQPGVYYVRVFAQDPSGNWSYTPLMCVSTDGLSLKIK
jgi:tetratricopeptide (TPR) repeat protein